MWYMHEGLGWWAVFGSVWMVLFWGGLAALVVWGISRFTRNGSSTQKQYPLEIARERYARGEISRDEFEHIKKSVS